MPIGDEGDDEDHRVSPESIIAVVALALQFKTANLECIVVTRDTKDRPGKISPAKACQRLRIPTTTIEEYLESMQEHFDSGLAIQAASDIRKSTP
ncbi:MAG: hypothetical protein F4208_07360 [Gemmatimonadales bacterium]|nr:hypothetical protein [Acidimicrobiia bacterium]MYG19374.1 hypothetical protein [Gemmatimonadales bacterium]